MDTNSFVANSPVSIGELYLQARNQSKDLVPSVGLAKINTFSISEITQL
jgi:hypothetical protein